MVVSISSSQSFMVSSGMPNIKSIDIFSKPSFLADKYPIFFSYFIIPLIKFLLPNVKNNVTKENMIKPYKGILPKIHETVFIEESAQIIGDVEIGEYSSVWFNAVVR